MVTVETPSLSAEQVWNCWKKNFGPWKTKYYGHIRVTTRSGEWTQGTIYPFIVTMLAPALDCRVRVRPDNMDAILFDESGHLLAHIEHENDLKEVKGELDKLEYSKPQLKCIVSYGYSPTSTDKNIAQIEKCVKDDLEPFMHAAIRRDSSQTWLFICAVRWEELESENDWIAYKFVQDAKEIRTVLLT